MPSNRAKFGLIVFMASMVMYKLLGYLYFLALSAHYHAYIPRTFEVEKTVFSHAGASG